MRKLNKIKKRILSIVLSCTMMVSLFAGSVSEVYASNENIFEPLIINRETLNASTVWGQGDTEHVMDNDGGFYSTAKSQSNAFPDNGKIETSDGIPYQLTWTGNSPYAGKDSIRFKGTKSGTNVTSNPVTMKMDTLGIYDKVYVLGTAGGFSDNTQSLNFRVTLSYTDGTTSTTTYSLYDWYTDASVVSGYGIGYKVFGRLNKDGDTIDNDFGHNGGPMLQSKEIDCDENRILKAITFEIADTPSSVANEHGIYAAIYAVTGVIQSSAPAIPVASVQGVESNAFTVSWEAVEGAVGYAVDVSNYPTFQDASGEPSFVSDYMNKMQTGINVVIEGLTEDTTYYFRVRAIGEDGAQSKSSEVVVATTKGVMPDEPETTYPLGTIVDLGDDSIAIDESNWCHFDVPEAGDDYIYITGLVPTQYLGEMSSADYVAFLEKGVAKSVVDVPGTLNIENVDYNKQFLNDEMTIYIANGHGKNIPEEFSVTEESVVFVYKFHKDNLLSAEYDRLEDEESPYFPGLGIDKTYIFALYGVHAEVVTPIPSAPTSPIIIEQPQDATVNFGEKATFSVTATGENLTYQWQVDYGNGDGFVKTYESGNNTATLTTYSTDRAYNGYKYRCIITDGNGNSVISDEATLTVNVSAPTEITGVSISKTANGYKVIGLEAAEEGYRWGYYPYKLDDGEDLDEAIAELFNSHLTEGPWENEITNSFDESYEIVTYTFPGREPAPIDDYDYIEIVKLNENSMICEVAILALPKSAAPEVTYDITLDRTNYAEGYVELYTYDSEGNDVAATQENNAAIAMPEGGSVKVYADSEFTVEAEGATVSEMKDAGEDGYYYELTGIEADTTVVVRPKQNAPIIDAPVITTHPENKTVEDGNTATFSVTATGENLIYQWQIDRNDGNGFVNLTGATSASYTTSAVDMDCNGFKYQCIVSNEGGSVTSDIATLTVTEKPSVHTHSLTQVPAKAATCTEEGNTVYYTCSGCDSLFADANGTTTTTAEAVKVAVLEHDWTGEWTVIKEATATEEGKKETLCTRGCGEKKEETIPVIEAEPVDAPVIVTHPENKTVEDGNTATFSVTATGENLTYQWQIDRNDGNGFVNLNGATSASYTTSAVDMDCDGFKYQCIVTNEGGSVTSNTATLTVTEKPEEHIHAISQEPAKEATCTEEGNKVYYTCLGCDSLFEDENATITTTAEAVKIAALDHDWTGEWTVVKEATATENGKKETLCTRGCGEKKEEVIPATGVESVDAPVITTHPENKTVEDGNTATFSVTATGENLIYQWQIDRNDGNGFVNLTGATSASYTTSAVDMDCDGFKYQCIVTNEGGSVTSNTATLTVTEKPSVHTHSLTQEPAKAATCTEEGNKAYYTCSGCDSLFADANGTTTTTAEAVKVAVLEHDWTGEWTVIKEATATEEGKKETLCTRGCGQKKVVVIPAIGTPDDEGSLDKYAEVKQDAPMDDVTLDNTKKELLEADNIFTDEEKTQIESGADAKVWIEISKTDESTMASTDKAKIEEEATQIMGENPEITYFDADLFRQVGNGAKQEISEPGIPMKITITIPGKLINRDKNILREFKIIRLHDGKVEIINGTFNAATGEFTFESDKFSTYAIVYKDVPVNDNDDNSTPGDTDVIKPEDDKKDEVPKTGDSNTTLYSFILMLLSGLGIIICSGKKKLLNKES